MAGDTLRVLFCIGVNPAFFDAGADERRDAFETITAAFADLGGRFGLQVLGTMDDDQTMVGSSSTWPWTCYILADAPDLAAVAAVCNLLRVSTLASGATLWKYLKIEARIGRELFFGNE
jgi:hypothetical protein